jgi:hypothetical protein
MKNAKLIMLGLLMSLSSINASAQPKAHFILVDKEQQEYVVQLSKMSRTEHTLESAKQANFTLVTCASSFIKQLLGHIDQPTQECLKEKTKLGFAMNGGVFEFKDPEFVAQIGK